MLPRRVAHVLIALVVIGALWGGTGRAGAAPNERANCTGEFTSGNAGPGFGEFVSGAAKAPSRGAGPRVLPRPERRKRHLRLRRRITKASTRS